MEYIAKILKREYKRDIVFALYKKKGLDQKTLDLEGRRKNLKNRIEIRRGISVKGKKILIIDDIFTTGATADECARILLLKEAADVVSLTLAID